MTDISNTAAGFTREGVASWISKKLGGLVWKLEGIDCTDVAEQAIEDASMRFSEVMPLIGYTSLPTGAKEWVLPEDGMGVLHMFFTDGSKFFTQTAYDLNKSLTGISSIQMAGGKVGEYADFLQWRKTFQRILGQRPTWLVLESERKVLITNNTGYTPCVMYSALRPFEKVAFQHRTIIRDLAYAEALERLAQVRAKFGGKIQGPGGTTIELDSDKLSSKADDLKEKAELRLKAVRMRFPIMWD